MTERRKSGRVQGHLEVLPWSVVAPPSRSSSPPCSAASWSPSRRPPAAADTPPVRVWVTTPDGTQRLSPADPATFTPGGSDQLTITVDPSRSYQTMRGFGASITDSSAVVLSRLRPAARDAAMTDLFSPSRGDGLSVLRQPMGASDFVAGDFYTYDDVPAGRDGLRDGGLHHRPRPAADPAAAAPGAARSTPT